MSNVINTTIAPHVLTIEDIENRHYNRMLTPSDFRAIRLTNRLFRYHCTKRTKSHVVEQYNERCKELNLK